MNCKIDKVLYMVLHGKAFHKFLFVLPNPLYQIGRVGAVKMFDRWQRPLFKNAGTVRRPEPVSKLGGRSKSWHDRG